MEEILPTLGLTFDACVTDPPYGETKLIWDRWPDGWPALVADVTSSLWCFGSMRMFLEHRDEFTAPGWKLSQDVVWEKHNGTSMAADRFKRVHEHVLHWYRGAWGSIHHDTPRATYADANRGAAINRGGRGPHLGKTGPSTYVYDGTRLVRSVLTANAVRYGEHPTEKPAGILQLLIEYAVPAGGILLDPFAGSGSTLATAKAIGRRAVGIEGDEKYAEIAAKRLCQDPLDFDEVT
jgi:site-specific DNA-methyltransferase (adenine-specific)